jgi:ferrous iron transport protein B
MSTSTSNCHSAGTDGTAESANRHIALVGHPNVGKSVMFKRLTGRYVLVSNYPGTTVELTRGSARNLADTAVIDTPGVVTIPARSEDEEVTMRVLLNEPLRTIVQVGDCKNLRRTLLLTLQLAEMGLPMVLALNMMDEAARREVVIDRQRLADRFGIAVLPTVAIRGEGVDEVVEAAEAAAAANVAVVYPEPVEDVLSSFAEMIPDAPLSPRAMGLLWLGDDRVTIDWVEEHVDAAGLERLAQLREQCRQALGEPAGAAIQRTRIAWVDELADEAVVSVGHRTGFVARLDRLTTHRFFAWPILAAVLYGMYWFVGVFGAGTLVGLIEEGLFGNIINPWVTQTVESLVPVQFIQDLLVGEYGLWTMGMTYALALVLPIVTTFFLAFSVLEDTGYLPRLTIVCNRLFAKLGLNGKAALPMVLGLGCVTMATLTTRILENKRDRVLTILLLALAIPCSAQLGVVLGILGAVSFSATLIWGGVLLAVLLTVGALAARLIPGERSTLLIELPPLRMPAPSNVAVKTLARLEWYLKEVIPLFLLGTGVLFVLDAIGALPLLEDAMEPIVTGWLGLPAAASAAFLVGFLRRDFAATGLFVLGAEGTLSAEQIVVAMVTITLFIPCVASVMMIARERGTKTAVAMTAFVFPFAFFVGGIVHQVLTAVGWNG